MVKTKKNLIIIAIAALAVLLYAAALPLTLHFTGAFKKTVPDLNINSAAGSTLYIPKTDAEKAALLASIGFDLQEYEAAGFAFPYIQTYGNIDDPDTVAVFKMETTDEKTFYIKLSIYMPGAREVFTDRRCYERRMINGQPVGFHQGAGDTIDESRARYTDTRTGCVFIIEPSAGFDAATDAFFNLLIR